MGDPAAEDLRGDHTESGALGLRLGHGVTWVYAALLLQVTIGSVTFLVAKRALHEIHPVTLLVCRFALSALFFCVLLTVYPGRALPPRNAKAWKGILLLGLLGGPLNQGLFLWGLVQSTPAHAALLYALTPLLVYLFGIWRGREHQSRRTLVGIALAFCGVAILLLGRGLGAALGPMIGDLFILGGVSAWALYTTEGKELTAQYGAVRATSWSMIAAGILILPLAPFYVSVPKLASASPIALGSILYLAALTSVVAYLLWYFALSRLEASKVAVFANLQPVLTALAAWGFLGEPLTWEIGVGGVLVLLGVRLAQTSVGQARLE
jgi:drug/metabolite transporter (DMT)-like permease